MDKVENEVRRLKLQDELTMLQATNIAKRSDETYDEHVLRRAQLNVRVDAIMSELYCW